MNLTAGDNLGTQTQEATSQHTTFNFGVMFSPSAMDNVGPDVLEGQAPNDEQTQAIDVKLPGTFSRKDIAARDLLDASNNLNSGGAKIVAEVVEDYAQFVTENDFESKVGAACGGTRASNGATFNTANQRARACAQRKGWTSVTLDIICLVHFDTVDDVNLFLTVRSWFEIPSIEELRKIDRCCNARGDTGAQTGAAPKFKAGTPAVAVLYGAREG